MRTQYIQSMMQTELSSVGATSRWGAHPPGFEPVVLQKKIPSSVPCPKHVYGPAYSQGDGPRVRVGAGWEQRFGGFLGLCEKIFFLIQYRRGGLSPLSSFFYTVNDQNITSHYVRSSEHKFFLVALLADISMFIYLQSLLQLLRQVIQLTQIDELVLFLGTLKI